MNIICLKLFSLNKEEKIERNANVNSINVVAVNNPKCYSEQAIDVANKMLSSLQNIKQGKFVCVFRLPITLTKLNFYKCHW